MATLKNLKIYIIFGLVVLGLQYFSPTDSTDVSRWKRSRMNLRIDYGTGCEYLSGGGLFGKEKLIPRVNRLGMHICRKENAN